MKNCIIAGSGRSGTSLLAGTLAHSGYFMGDDLYPPRDSNPKGFFEDPFINSINEDILALAKVSLWEKARRKFINNELGESQRWLESLPLSTHIVGNKCIESRIAEAVGREPFCYKDPRFSYTLPVWRPFLENTVFVCVFREPALTAKSILVECERMDYLQSVDMTINRALRIWYNIHNHILKIHASCGDWLFLHYNQLSTESGLEKLERFTGAVVDKTFYDSSLKRTSSSSMVPFRVKKLYSRLCALAGYDDPLS